jgi:hypothetical protein
LSAARQAIVSQRETRLLDDGCGRSDSPKCFGGSNCSRRMSTPGSVSSIACMWIAVGCGLWPVCDRSPGPRGEQLRRNGGTPRLDIRELMWLRLRCRHCPRCFHHPWENIASDYIFVDPVRIDPIVGSSDQLSIAVEAFCLRATVAHLKNTEIHRKRTVNRGPRRSACRHFNRRRRDARSCLVVAPPDVGARR